MLPRSRSPLLPSPTSATNICDLDFSCSSSSQSSVQASLPRQPPPLHPKPLPSKPLVLAKPIPPAKPSKPAKPPRKSLETVHNREQVCLQFKMNRLFMIYVKIYHNLSALQFLDFCFHDFLDLFLPCV